MYLFTLPIQQTFGEPLKFEVIEFIFNINGKITDIVVKVSNKDIEFKIKV